MSSKREERALSADEIEEPDTTLRVIGMLVGGGAGAFLLFLLATYVRGVPVELLLGLPGIGLAIGLGLSSLRRSKPWGIVAIVLGYAWTVCVLWLRAPRESSLVELALRLPFTLSGAPNVLLIAVVGYLVGAGWKKAPLEPAEDE
ncbi:MAG: hypothetical protein EXS08_03885 [Planctomycetes bacterium]|nr:hypothetical protein [Planctomycetota bacterium]